MRVSVIIPAFNAARTLGACLEAVRRAAGEKAEVLVVDDGSNDGTREVALNSGARLLEQRRQGPAAARNAGARASSGEFLVFVDSDVAVHGDAIGRLLGWLEADGSIAAAFGCYDAAPRVEGVVARYRNLLHAYTHQTGEKEASTFWAGLGAVRRTAFEQAGGFDAGRFEQASIEDIEFGMRIKAAGGRIRLDPEALGTHWKEWTLEGMVLTDLWSRAVPWTRLLRQAGSMPNDLNLKWGQRASVALAWSMAPAAALGLMDARWLGGCLLAAALHILLNAGFLRWVWRSAGPRVAAASIPLHVLFHWVAGLGFLIGSLTPQTREARVIAGRGAART